MTGKTGRLGEEEKRRLGERKSAALPNQKSAALTAHESRWDTGDDERCSMSKPAGEVSDVVVGITAWDDGDDLPAFGDEWLNQCG